MEKKFEDLVKFRHRSIELFESSDPHMTAIYFTNSPDKHDKTSSAVFQVLCFGHRDVFDKWYDHGWFIRKPGDEYFTELTGGSNNSRGSMQNGSCKNPWETLSFRRNYQFHKHDQDLLFRFDSEFNFMKLIERRSISKYDFNESVIENTFGEDNIIEALSRKYLRLPEDVREVTYAFKVTDKEEYIGIDYPHYEFSYDTHRFFYIKNGKGFEEMKMSNFQRYRDGGTTLFDVTDVTGAVHKFYSPSPFSKDEVATWDGVEIIDVMKDKILMDKLVFLLGIELEKKSEKEIEVDNL